MADDPIGAQRQPFTRLTLEHLEALSAKAQDLIEAARDAAVEPHRRKVLRRFSAPETLQYLGNISSDTLYRRLKKDANKARGIVGALATFGPASDPTAFRLGAAANFTEEGLWSRILHRTAEHQLKQVQRGLVNFYAPTTCIHCNNLACRSASFVGNASGLPRASMINPTRPPSISSAARALSPGPSPTSTVGAG